MIRREKGTTPDITMQRISTRVEGNIPALLLFLLHMARHQGYDTSQLALMSTAVFTKFIECWIKQCQYSSLHCNMLSSNFCIHIEIIGIVHLIHHDQHIMQLFQQLTIAVQISTPYKINIPLRILERQKKSKRIRLCQHVLRDIGGVFQKILSKLYKTLTNRYIRKTEEKKPGKNLVDKKKLKIPQEDEPNNIF